jgi:hypothetical protein
VLLGLHLLQSLLLVRTYVLHLECNHLVFDTPIGGAPPPPPPAFAPPQAATFGEHSSVYLIMAYSIFSIRLQVLLVLLHLHLHLHRALVRNNWMHVFSIVTVYVFTCASAPILAPPMAAPMLGSGIACIITSGIDIGLNV